MKSFNSYVLILFIFIYLSFPPKTFGITPILIIPPKDLIQVLNQKFPGFRIADKTDYCWAEKDFIDPNDVKPPTWAYGILSADFNRDGLPDYSLIIRHNGKLIWIGALKNKNARSPYDVTEFGPARAWGCPNSKIEVKGMICDKAIGVQMFRTGTTTDSIPYVGIETNMVGVHYFWKDGRWKESGYDNGAGECLP